MPYSKEIAVPTDTIQPLSSVIFDATTVEITMAKPAVPEKLPKRREIPETPSPIPDRRPNPTPIEVPPSEPASPIKEPALPAKIPVPSHS